ncbi:hypothetical protein IFM89_038426 [Coptis chinensis]|uniref:Uncharacterized protein n=1 Tax=Coptis chinensis TaxID=261450 RepID=A0A835H8K9_9MAGN|nr:hypothetical protein IFM89_038426 [Coptis chinensis]
MHKPAALVGSELGLGSAVQSKKIHKPMHHTRFFDKLEPGKPGNIRAKPEILGGGIAEELLSEMFESDSDTSEDGISLLVCRKLLKLMNGDVQYLREAGKSSFITKAQTIERCMTSLVNMRNLIDLFDGAMAPQTKSLPQGSGGTGIVPADVRPPRPEDASDISSNFINCET